MESCFGLIQNSLSYLQEKFKHKKSSGFHQSFQVAENLELSNLLEDFYKVVELYDYIENDPSFTSLLCQTDQSTFHYH